MVILIFIIGPTLYIIFQNDWVQNLKITYAVFGLFMLGFLGHYYYDIVHFDVMTKELIRRYPGRIIYLVESGITFDNQYSTTNLKYKSIIEIKESEEYIFFFFDDKHAHFIPCRAFSSDTEKKIFLSEVANGIQESQTKF